MAAAGVALGLRCIDDERIPRVAVVSAAFFVASLIHVPIGPSSAHLVLNGLTGAVLGWEAFPAMLVALLLQAVFFGFGGLTTLGVNVTAMAAPALLAHYAARPLVRSRSPGVAAAGGALAGGLGIAAGAGIVAGALILAGEEFANVAKLVLLAHAPIAAVEAAITAAVVVFLKRVKPEVLAAVGRNRPDRSSRTARQHSCSQRWTLPSAIAA